MRKEKLQANFTYGHDEKTLIISKPNPAIYNNNTS